VTATVRPELRYRAAAAVGGRLLDALFATVRYELLTEETDRPFRDRGEGVIFVLWHGRLLPMAHRHRDQNVITLVSRSADGEYIARTLERWGFGSARGSSSRGGDRALRELVRHVRTGRSVAVTPDGPRGPREQVKPGALLLAQLTGQPLIPTAAGTTRAWWFGKWDRFLVPKPFARIRVAYGTPQHVPRDGGAAALEAAAARLQRSLADLTRVVDGGERVRGDGAP
jgi:lysophospholipid acyltransferase (LPLAT)-like uncharacterized protein